MSRRVRFTPLLVAGAVAAGLVGTAPSCAEATEVPFALQNVVSSTVDIPVSVHATDVDGDGDTDVVSTLTRTIALGDRPRGLSFEWIVASGPDARDGSLRLFADGRPAGSLDELPSR